MAKVTSGTPTQPGGIGRVVHAAENNIPTQKANEDQQLETQTCTTRTTIILNLLVIFIIISSLIIFIAFKFLPYGISNEPRRELIFVYMIWRHGDRAPVHKIPNLEFDPEIFSNGPGNLTEEGFKQSEILGKILIDRYRNKGILEPGSVYIRSTNFYRTKKTAELMIESAGLQNVQWGKQIIINEDVEAYPFISCRRIQPSIERFKVTQNVTMRHMEVDEILMKELNFKNDSYIVYDILSCMKFHNLSLPNWATDDIIEKIRQICWMKLEMQFGMGEFKNELIKKIRGGSILRGAVRQIAEVIACRELYNQKPCNKKFFGLSAHDITLISLISVFQNSSDFLKGHSDVKYCSNIAFEVWKENKKYKLKVIYSRSLYGENLVITKHAPGCENSSGFCDVFKFLNSSRKLFFDNPLKHCRDSRRHAIPHSFDVADFYYNS